MNRIRIVGLLAAVGGLLLLQGCAGTPLGGALQTYQTVTDPAASYGDKGCAVLQWGVPLATQRYNTFTPTQKRYVDFALQVAAGGCAARTATDRERLLAAGDALSTALWKLVP